MLTIAGREERNHAFVIGRASCAVDLLVQLRDNGENHREEEGADATGGDDRAQDCFAISQAQAHFVGESAPGADVAQA